MNKIYFNIKDLFITQWKNDLNNDNRSSSTSKNKLRTYRLFKQKFGLEEYLTKLQNYELRNIMSKFRLGSHKLKIETGRHSKTPVEKRTCPTCIDQLEDEKHFIMYCKSYQRDRECLFHYISSKIPNFLTLDDNTKFTKIMSNNSCLIKLAQFIKIGLLTRQHPP